MPGSLDPFSKATPPVASSHLKHIHEIFCLESPSAFQRPRYPAGPTESHNTPTIVLCSKVNQAVVDFFHLVHLAHRSNDVEYALAGILVDRHENDAVAFDDRVHPALPHRSDEVLGDVKAPHRGEHAVEPTNVKLRASPHDLEVHGPPCDKGTDVVITVPELLTVNDHTEPLGASRS